MNKKQLEELRPRFDEEIESLGYEMVDVEFVRENKESYLRFFIYNPEGTTVDDCEAVSNHLSPLLDELDPIDGNYYLEVSSPDLNRPLKNAKDYKRYLDEQVELSFYQKREGEKSWIVTLKDFDDEYFTVERNKKEHRIPKVEVAQMKPAIIF